MNLNLRRLIKLFIHHPESNGETYFQHFRCASSYGLSMIFSGLAAIIHSVFPFLFETAASDCAKKINEEIDRRSQNSLIR